jgi:hypothetical protein
MRSDCSARNDLSSSGCAPRGGACSVGGFGPTYFGVFRCVKTRTTPDARSASAVSIAAMVPFAMLPLTMKP